MPYCPNCGANLEKEVTFCPYCGAPQKAAQPQQPKTQAAPPRETREDRWKRRHELREERRKARAEARARRIEEKEEKEEKGEKEEKQEKGEKGEKGEKHEGHRHGFLGPLIGGFVLLWLGATFYLTVTGNPSFWIVEIIFIGGLVLLVLIGIAYGARLARRRSPQT